jgi:hypothetical protein
MKTFAQAVADFLDQYWTNEKQGRFISVDPDGDGDKQAIWVQDDGTVNPRSDKPGKWKGYEPEVIDKPEKGKPKYKIKDIGLRPFVLQEPQKNKDGTVRKNSKPKLKQSEAVKKVMRFDRETGEWRALTKSGQLIDRKKRESFDDVAKSRAFEEGYEPTPSDIARVKELAKQIQKETNERSQEIVDAMRQLFSNRPGGLSAWQARARAANDIRGLEDFGIDQIISGQTYSDDETNLLPIIRAHAGYLMQGGDDDEQAVFEALRKPLPKPVALNNPAIVERAGTLYAEEREQDSELEQDYSRGFIDLLNQKQELFEQNADYEEIADIERQMQSQYTDDFNRWYGDDEEIWGDEEEADQNDFTSVPFQATSFADAVEFYKANDNGRFITVRPNDEEEGHVIFVTDDGVVNPKSKNPGEWKKFKTSKPNRVEKGEEGAGRFASTTEKMQNARDKYVEQKGKVSTTYKKSFDSVVKRLGGSEKILNAPLKELDATQVTARAILEHKQAVEELKRSKGEVAKIFKKHVFDSGKSFLDSETIRELQTEISQVEGWQKQLKGMLKKIGKDKDYSVDYDQPSRGLLRAFEFTTKANTNSEQTWGYTVANFSVFDGQALDTLMTKHRNAVRKAVKAGEDVPAYITDTYSHLPWAPGEQTSKKSEPYVKWLDDHKKTGKFRVQASEGRKLRKQANDAVDSYRKSLLSKNKSMNTELTSLKDELNQMRDTYWKEKLFNDETKLEAYHTKSDELKQKIATIEREMRTLLRTEIDKMPSNRKRPVGKRAIDAKLKGNTQVSQQSLDAAVDWLEHVSGGALTNYSVDVTTAKPSDGVYYNRSAYFFDQDTVKMSPRQSNNTAILIHELCHSIDHKTAIGPKTKAFQSAAIQKHKTRALGKRYETWEIGSQNGFNDAYTGKYYNGGRSSEVLTMGAQKLYENWIELAEKSPDHFNYTIAALRGLI